MLALSRLLVDMIETDKYGYYHATNEGGYISWYDFTKEIFKQAVELGHTEYYLRAILKGRVYMSVYQSGHLLL